MKQLICNQPDHDIPSIVCGAPLPCCYHTAVIDLSTDPGELRIPITGKSAIDNRDVLLDIGDALIVKKR